MPRPRFLFDANVPGPLTQALRQHQPTMDILCSGEPGAPAMRAPDPDLLLTAEALQRLLLTGDRKSMPRHLQNHYDAGHHTWGVLLMRNGYPLADFYQEIVLIWTASEADEWRDVMLYIP